MNAQEIEAAIAHAEALAASVGVAEVGDDVVVEGYALKWDSIANGGRGPTRFDPKAFGDGARALPLLWQHHDDAPIGTARVAPDSAGLKATARISNTGLGRDAAQLIADGAATGFSIGFNVTKADMGPDGVRIVRLAELAELSIVTFPADRSARVARIGGRPVTVHAADPLEHEQQTQGPAVMAVLARLEAEVAPLLGPAGPTSSPRPRDVFGREVTREREDARRVMELNRHVADWRAGRSTVDPKLPENIREPLRRLEVEERVAAMSARWE
jgi:HK97 family phage prohead protease